MQLSTDMLRLEHYALLLLALVLCIIYFVFCWYAFILDLEELKQIKVSFFQDSIFQCSRIYSVSLTIKERILKRGVTDIIFRLRGSSKDAPLVLYRDVTGRTRKPLKVINIGIALPFSIGKPLELDVACDNTSNKTLQPTIAISDIYVRQYPRWTLTQARSDTSTYSLWKERNLKETFSSLCSDIQVWACVETITNTQGAGIIGIETNVRGRDQILRARSNAKTFSLTKEDPHLRRLATLQYRPLHYLFSLSSKWHDAWSDYSRLDHVFVLLLDQLAAIVAVSACFAFGLEEFLGIPQIENVFQTMYPTVQFRNISDFDVVEFLGSFTAEDFVPYMINITHVLWLSLLCSFVVVPLSLVWCRLFRLVGGKGFENVLGNTGDTSAVLQPSTGASSTEDQSEPVPTSLMLRTLECRNVHSGYCTTTNRRLKVEPMICNCQPDYGVARAVAFARSKMANLRDKSVPSGPKGIKNPQLFHESHTQSTDAPIMPQPSTSMDGRGHILRVGRYCERVVQQAPESILDNAVIAECFEVAPKLKHEKIKTDFKQKTQKRCRESSSEAKLFSEEDANSVNDMVRNFTPRQFPAHPGSETDAAAPHADDAANQAAEEKRVDKIMKTFIGRKVAPASKPTPKSKKARKSQKANSSRTAVRDDRSASTMTKIENSQGHKFDIGQLIPSCGVARESSESSSEVGHPPGSGVPVCIGERTTYLASSSLMSDRVCEAEEYSDVSDSVDCEHGTAQAPFPSASQFATSLKADNLDLDSIEGPPKHPPAPQRCGAQLLKRKAKLVAFSFLVLFQLIEIFLITSVPVEGFNQFYLRRETGVELVRGRMHAAFLSCLLCLVVYFLFTIHLIALISQYIDHCLHGRRVKSSVHKTSSYMSIQTEKVESESAL